MSNEKVVSGVPTKPPATTKGKRFDDLYSWDTEIGAYVPKDGPKMYDENPAEALLWAKQQYLGCTMSVAEMARHSGIPEWRLRRWITQHGWNKEKRKAEKEIYDEVVKRKGIQFTQVLDKLLLVLDRRAEQILADNEKININEFNKLTNSAETLHRMEQLRIGAPTQIYDHSVKLTREAVVKKLLEVDIIDYPELAERVAAVVEAPKIPDLLTKQTVGLVFPEPEPDPNEELV